MVCFLAVSRHGLPSLRHEIDAEFAQHDDGQPEQRDGHDAVREQCGPKAPALAQQPRKHEKHRQGGQHKPERALGMIGDARGGLLFLMHPDHRDQ